MTTETRARRTRAFRRAAANTLTASLIGYLDTSVPVAVVADETTEISIGMLALGAGGDNVAIVLSWGVAPLDLDLHVSGPDGVGGRFHIAYYSLTPVEHASLDLDDLVSFGPETVTIMPRANEAYVAGDYRIWIHNYSNEEEFDVSYGLITLFAGGTQFAQYSIGDATGDPSLDIWRVVDFALAEDGTISQINAVQTYLDGTEGSEF